MTNTLQVAETIKEQLGGNRFAMMTGSKNFAGSANHLQFQVGRFAGLKIKFVKITLEPNDLYSMKFFDKNCKVIKEYGDVYGNELASIFSAATGLDTRI